MGEAIVQSPNSPLTQTDKQRLDTLWLWANKKNGDEKIINARLENCENTLNFIANRFEALDTCTKKVEELMHTVNGMFQKINMLEKRFTNYEGFVNSVQAISQNWNVLDLRVKEYQQSVVASEQKTAQYVQQSIAASEQKKAQYIQQSVAAVEQRIDTKLPQLIRQHTDNLKQNIATVTASQQNIEDKLKRINATVTDNMQTIRELEERLKRFEEKLDGFSTTPSQNMSSVPQQRPPARDTSSNKAVSDFNVWACNPSSRLPYGFYYIAGDVHIRKEQSFSKSGSETKWISNESTGEKFLFPNPNLFSLTTDIHELYKMDQSRLRKQGENKIKITSPCEIKDNGFINYAGELEFV